MNTIALKVINNKVDKLNKEIEIEDKRIKMYLQNDNEILVNIVEQNKFRLEVCKSTLLEVFQEIVKENKIQREKDEAEDYEKYTYMYESKPDDLPF